MSTEDPEPTLTDADDSIVLDDLVRSGEESRLRRRGAVRIDHGPHVGISVDSGPIIPRLRDDDDHEAGDADSDSSSESLISEDGGYADWRHSYRIYRMPVGDLFTDDEEDEERLRNEGQNLAQSYVLYCGGAPEKPNLHERDRAFEPSTLPSEWPSSPGASSSSSAPGTSRSNGCGAPLRVTDAKPHGIARIWSASTRELFLPGPYSNIVAVDSIYSDLAPDGEHFNEVVYECGCVDEGIACRSCGNILGKRHVICPPRYRPNSALHRRLGLGHHTQRHSHLSIYPSFTLTQEDRRLLFSYVSEYDLSHEENDPSPSSYPQNRLGQGQQPPRKRRKRRPRNCRYTFYASAVSSQPHFRFPSPVPRPRAPSPAPPIALPSQFVPHVRGTVVPQSPQRPTINITAGELTVPPAPSPALSPSPITPSRRRPVRRRSVILPPAEQVAANFPRSASPTALQELYRPNTIIFPGESGSRPDLRRASQGPPMRGSIPFPTQPDENQPPVSPPPAGSSQSTSNPFYSYILLRTTEDRDRIDRIRQRIINLQANAMSAAQQARVNDAMEALEDVQSRMNSLEGMGRRAIQLDRQAVEGGRSALFLPVSNPTDGSAVQGAENISPADDAQAASEDPSTALAHPPIPPVFTDRGRLMATMLSTIELVHQDLEEVAQRAEQQNENTPRQSFSTMPSPPPIPSYAQIASSLFLPPVFDNETVGTGRDVGSAHEDGSSSRRNTNPSPISPPRQPSFGLGSRQFVFPRLANAPRQASSLFIPPFSSNETAGTGRDVGVTREDGSFARRYTFQPSPLPISPPRRPSFGFGSRQFASPQPANAILPPEPNPAPAPNAGEPSSATTNGFDQWFARFQERGRDVEPRSPSPQLHIPSDVSVTILPPPQPSLPPPASGGNRLALHVVEDQPAMRFAGQEDMERRDRTEQGMPLLPLPEPGSSSHIIYVPGSDGDTNEDDGSSPIRLRPSSSQGRHQGASNEQETIWVDRDGAFLDALHRHNEAEDEEVIPEWDVRYRMPRRFVGEDERAAEERARRLGLGLVEGEMRKRKRGLEYEVVFAAR